MDMPVTWRNTNSIFAVSRAHMGSRRRGQRQPEHYCTHGPDGGHAAPATGAANSDSGTANFSGAGLSHSARSFPRPAQTMRGEAALAKPLYPNNLSRPFLPSIWAGRRIVACAWRVPRRIFHLPGSRPTTAHSLIAAIDVNSEDLLVQPPATNWISYNGDYSGRRYSSLSEINTDNLAGARRWVFHARNSSRLEVTPVVVNGMMLVTAANDAFALDARTGRVVWHHAWPISEGLIDDASRPHQPRRWSLARPRLHGNRQRSSALPGCAFGNLIWDVPYADWNKNYGATSAPLVVKDKVLVGTSGGDDGVRGFVAAYDATDR